MFIIVSTSFYPKICKKVRLKFGGIKIITTFAVY